jgi:hypothetical protein
VADFSKIGAVKKIGTVNPTLGEKIGIGRLRFFSTRRIFKHCEEPVKQLEKPDAEPLHQHKISSHQPIRSLAIPRTERGRTKGNIAPAQRKGAPPPLPRPRWSGHGRGPGPLAARAAAERSPAASAVTTSSPLPRLHPRAQFRRTPDQARDRGNPRSSHRKLSLTRGGRAGEGLSAETRIFFSFYGARARVAHWCAVRFLYCNLFAKCSNVPLINDASFFSVACKR